MVDFNFGSDNNIEPSQIKTRYNTDPILDTG